MPDTDIVTRLRQQADGFLIDCPVGPRMAADEIERLRGVLGQVSDADAFLSETDAAQLDGMLNWCEFNAMEWHRALARLVADRARLRHELFPIRKELEQMRTERNQARAELCIMHPRAEDPVAYARSRGWNDLFKDEA